MVLLPRMLRAATVLLPVVVWRQCRRLQRLLSSVEHVPERRIIQLPVYNFQVGILGHRRLAQAAEAAPTAASRSAGLAVPGAGDTAPGIGTLGHRHSGFESKRRANKVDMHFALAIAGARDPPLHLAQAAARRLVLAGREGPVVQVNPQRAVAQVRHAYYSELRPRGVQRAVHRPVVDDGEVNVVLPTYQREPNDGLRGRRARRRCGRRGCRDGARATPSVRGGVVGDVHGSPAPRVSVVAVAITVVV
mmetsp:Transcript_56497/g.145474  ORF Transcript_56497/g.145474 Transcript_56497/m.145474 type:complete len:248 (+) Transcript_56497:620-1363(+)